MKKIYRFLMTLAAFVLAGAAQATDYVPNEAIDGLPEEGTQFVLQISGGGQSGQYLRGIAMSTALDDANLYEFEYVDTDADGNQRVYLKQVSTGEYLKYMRVDDGLDGNDQWGMEQNCWYTSEASEAFLLTALINENGKINLRSQDTWRGDAGTPDYTYFGVWTIPSLGNWIDKDWIAYSVLEQTPYEKLFSYIENNFPGGVENAYVVGTEPGCVSQEAFDAMKAAYDAAFALTEKPMDEVSAEEAEAAIAALVEAKAKIEASIVPIKEGYYYIHNILYPRQAAFVDTSVGGNPADQGWGSIWHDARALDAPLSAATAKYVWRIIPTGENATYYIQNYLTGTYVDNTYHNNGANPINTKEACDVPYLIRSGISLNSNSRKGFAISPADFPSFSWNRNGGDARASVVFWQDLAGDNSFWYLTYIPEEEIEGLADAIAQSKLNDELAEKITAAKEALNSATYYNSDATKDGNFPNANGEGAEEYLADGLFTSADQATTNAPEPNEGQPQGLISQMVDGNNASFFHSTWSANNQYVSDVCVDIDLRKECTALTAKLEFRITNGAAHANGRPYHVTYYGTNDASLLLTDTIDPAAADSASYEGWTELGQTTFSYPYANSDGVAGTVGIAGMPFGDGHSFRYLRLRFTDNYGGETAGWKYVCISELRLYEATVDPKSPIVNVAETTVNNLKAQIAAAQDKVAAGTVTREDINAFQAALDAFIAECPDPNTLLSAISAARALLNGAPVGDEIGYYPQEAVDAFKAVVDEVEATYAGDMAMELINQGKARLEEATKAFRLALNLPEAGRTYALICGTEAEARNGAYVRAQNNGRSSSLQWVKEDGIDPSMQLNYLWIVEKIDGFNIQLRNVGTGLYLNDQTALSTGVTQTDSVNSREIISANAPGMFNIKIGETAEGEGRYLNAAPGVEGATFYNVVAWSSFANGTDNGAFRFEEVDLNRGGESAIAVQAGRLQIISLPYAIQAGENMYRVAGTNAEKTEVYCNAISEGETIAAGEAFIYQAAEEETEIYVLLADSELPLGYSQENKNVNGLQALLEGGQAPVGEAIINAGIARIASTGVRSVGANSGYITVAATDNVVEGGDLTLTLDGVLNAIGNVEISGAAGAGKIYDLSGRRVTKAQKGLYIIDGKKILVK